MAITTEQIEKLAGRSRVRKNAVENFLITVYNNPDEFSAFMNLHKDTELYGWNPATFNAISEGIKEAFKE